MSQAIPSVSSNEHTTQTHSSLASNKDLTPTPHPPTTIFDDVSQSPTTTVSEGVITPSPVQLSQNTEEEHHDDHFVNIETLG